MEKDDEVKGNGNSLDFGERIYDSRIGKFLSIDPLTKSFPMLTPYQFASNRPIDGIDIDGLEWITYKILLVNGGAVQIGKIDHTKTMSNSRIEKVHKTSVEKFYKEYSKSFEEKGRGILYEYYELDKNNNPVKIGEYMENKESIQRIGLYGGVGCVTYCGGNDENNPFAPKIDGTDYDFSNDPIDKVDGASKTHDIGQENLSKPFLGHWNDKRTLDGDKKFVEEIEVYQDKAKSKDFKDKYTGRPQSQEAKRNAWQAKLYFKNFEIPRKEKLNKENK
jgi:RHS repeat-associated protein